eukprot:TRINITY_DN4114_c0_g1_i2.p1 TRINITY_DN4114_c0_g1~~TRINITY_DN4114_c0_g1_i2.p1  ORF type:complete len:391 (+),score=100.88 TRINITY_DN4114_c0_g1_i2:88-1260(+)
MYRKGRITWEKKFFVLKWDHLAISDTQDSTSKTTLSLEDASIKEIDLQGLLCLELCVGAQKNKVHFRGWAKSSKDRPDTHDEWLNLIQTQIAKLEYLSFCKANSLTPDTKILYHLQNESRREMILDSHPFYAPALSALRLDLKSCCVCSLSLRASAIDDHTLAALTEALSRNQSVTSLNLASNKLTDRSGLSLASLLTLNETLTHLDLQGNKLGDVGFTAVLTSMFQHTLPVVQKMNFSHNGITDVGLQNVAQQMLNFRENAKRSTLECLDLNFNLIGDLGVKGLARALEADVCPLTRLDLAHNRIGNDGALALAAGLQKCSRVKTVDVTHNLIEGAGAAALARVTATWVVKEIDLSFNKVGCRQLRLIADVFRELPARADCLPALKISR